MAEECTSYEEAFNIAIRRMAELATRPSVDVVELQAVADELKAMGKALHDKAK